MIASFFIDVTSHINYTQVHSCAHIHRSSFIKLDLSFVKERNK